MARFPLLAAALLSVSFASSASAQPKDAEAGPKKAEVAVREIFRISLPCDEATGFKWELASVDRGVAAPAGPITFRKSDKAGRFGPGGTCELWMQGVKPGRTKAVLVYRRPWEKKEPVKTFATVIVVRAAKP